MSDGPVKKLEVDPGLAGRVSSLALRASKAVDGLLGGLHRSTHRGASVVFMEHREYQPGDDPRLLDWRAYARTDEYLIKRFEQESQLRATLVLDLSGSMQHTAKEASLSKLDYAATLLAALALVLFRQGDAVGALAFDDIVRATLAARSRADQLDAIFRTLAHPPRAHRATHLHTALGQVAEQSGSRGVIAIASDLIDVEQDALAPLAYLTGRQNQVLIFHTLGNDELEFPFHGPTRFLGLESEPSVEADADQLRAGYLDNMHELLDSRRRACAAAGAHYVLARTGAPVEEVLATALSKANLRR
ncbi:MAG: DUF58 domain-containing protein [Myxococcota bacterium]